MKKVSPEQYAHTAFPKTLSFPLLDTPRKTPNAFQCKSRTELFFISLQTAMQKKRLRTKENPENMRNQFCRNKTSTFFYFD